MPDFREKKSRGERIAMLTAYDATMARLFDQAGVDALLVGDSLGTVILGRDQLAVTLEAMIHHTRAVRAGAAHALVVADMPFMTYQASVEDAVRNAGRLVQEGGAAAVKLEGGRPILDAVARLTAIGIPVMGHLGLLPQSIHQLGSYSIQATTPGDAAALVDDAVALERAGAFAVVLEAVPSDAARQVTARLSIPTVGIGAGPECDGQILVSYDMLGLFDRSPSFARQYASLARDISTATRAFVDDVRGRRFPEVPTAAGSSRA